MSTGHIWILLNIEDQTTHGDLIVWTHDVQFQQIQLRRHK